MRIDLEVEEVRELHDLASFICRRAPGENEALESALSKLREAGISALGPRPAIANPAEALITQYEKAEADAAQQRRDRHA